MARDFSQTKKTLVADLVQLRRISERYRVKTGAKVTDDSARVLRAFRTCIQALEKDLVT